MRASDQRVVLTELTELTDLSSVPNTEHRERELIVERRRHLWNRVEWGSVRLIFDTHFLRGRQCGWWGVGGSGGDLSSVPNREHRERELIVDARRSRVVPEWVGTNREHWEPELIVRGG